MTDDKRDATFHPGGSPVPPVIPGYPETIARHGAADEAPTERPWASPGTPPWSSLSTDIRHEAPRAWRPSWRDNLAAMNPSVKYPVIGALVIVLITLAAIAVQRTNVLPAGVPLIGKDSGLAACESIQHDKAPVGLGSKVSPGDFAKARKVFADSRYPAIRDNGVKLMDLAVQISALGKDPGIGALAYIQAFTDAYAGLAGGCAAVGHPIPALTTN
jgi:hypothetical protein